MNLSIPLRKAALLWSALIAAAMLAAGCSTGDFGSIFGQGNDRAQQVEATVQSVDTRNRRLIVIADRREEAFYYDDRTVVNYRGEQYRPEALERGDRITASVTESDNRWWVNEITVTYDSTAGNDRYPDNNDARYSNVRGFIRDVDTRNNTIELEADRRIIELAYDTGTKVEYRGQNYNPESLQRGDEVEVTLQESGPVDWAIEIDVLNSVGTSPVASRNDTDIRGTVDMIDTRDQYITLRGSQIVQDFIRDGGINSERVYYDNQTRVMFEGREYAPTNLERGDEIEIDVREVNRTYLADTIYVVTDVNTRR